MTLSKLARSVELPFPQLTRQTRMPTLPVRAGFAGVLNLHAEAAFRATLARLPNYWCGGAVRLRVWREHVVLTPVGPGRSICARVWAHVDRRSPGDGAPV